MILSKTTEYALTVLGFMATRNESMYSAEYNSNCRPCQIRSCSFLLNSVILESSYRGLWPRSP